MSTRSRGSFGSPFFPRLSDLPRETLLAVRTHSKRVYGNQDRLEVAVAITRVQLGEVNATDLSREIAVAVNRIRSQLLALEALGLLAKTGGGDAGRRMFKVQDPEDLFWVFAEHEFDLVMKDPPEIMADAPAPAPVRVAHSRRG